MSENEVVEGSEDGALTRAAEYVGSTIGSATRAVSDTAQAAASIPNLNEIIALKSSELGSPLCAIEPRLPAGVKSLT